MSLDQAMASAPTTSPSPGEVAISVRGLGKAYQMHERPSHRLQQGLSGKRRSYYKHFNADIAFRLVHDRCRDGVGDGYDHTQQHWIFDALEFRALDKTMRFGLVGIPMLGITVEKEVAA